MKSSAPGQLLGFSIQYPRALYHLLTSGPGHTVCLEILGDVATIAPNEIVIAEEDKSSIVGNPLTDRSTDLWKTFANWIQAVKDGELVIENTQFLLYTNQRGRPAIVNKFSSAQTPQEALEAIIYTKEQLNDVTNTHAIWEYYDFVVNQNERLLANMIQKFELEIGQAAGYKDIELEIRRKTVPENQIDFLANELSGWLLKKVSDLISANQCARISWEEFDQHFLVLFDRCRCRELIDFASKYPPKHSEINHHVKIRPVYLKQLDSIGILDDDILEAVSDYLRAKVNHDKWIESGIIDEDVAGEFESKLRSYWKSQKKRIELTETASDDNKKGRLLLIDCIQRQETIRGESPPSPTIAGTYHALADEPVLGWHPNWDDLFSKKKEE